MITPAKRNITIFQRATFRETYNLKDSNNQSIDIRNWLIEAQLWDEERLVKYADFEVILTDPANGIFELALSDDITSTLDTPGVYDIAITQTNRDRDYWVEGSFKINKGYT